MVNNFNVYDSLKMSNTLWDTWRFQDIVLDVLEVLDGLDGLDDFNVIDSLKWLDNLNILTKLEMRNGCKLSTVSICIRVREYSFEDI